MSDLLTAEEFKAQVQTALADPVLQRIIDLEDSEITRLYGVHFSSTVGFKVTETKDGRRKKILFFRRRITSIVKITEDAVILDNTNNDVWRLNSLGFIERLPEGSGWGTTVIVEYVPENDNDLRTSVLIELTRIAINHTAYQSESVAGEYSYTVAASGNWEEVRAQQLKRLLLR